MIWPVMARHGSARAAERRRAAPWLNQNNNKNRGEKTIKISNLSLLTL